jgi:hypothetical protein
VAATIVYDGPDHDRVQVSNNVTVIYSGGGSRAAKHRADKRIEELLNWRTFAGESTPVFLVTDDYDLGQALCANIAETFTPQLISVEGGEVLDYGSTYA